MPSDGLFDMERYTLLSSPSSSTRSSPAPDPRSIVVRSAAGVAHMPHRSSPASQVARGGSGSVGLASRASVSEADMASAYSDSAPARASECLFIRASCNVC
jgi:hypothetical protein